MKENLQDVDVNGRIILKLILKKYAVRLWAPFNVASVGGK
jgi:hypothetical protein